METDGGKQEWSNRGVGGLAATSWSASSFPCHHPREQGREQESNLQPHVEHQFVHNCSLHVPMPLSSLRSCRVAYLCLRTSACAYQLPASSACLLRVSLLSARVFGRGRVSSDTRAFPCCVRVHRYWGTYCKRCNFGRSSCGLTATHTTTPQPRSVRPAAGGREWDGLETWRHLDTHIKALTCSNSNSLNRWQPGWMCGLAAARCILSQIKLKIKRTFFLCLPVAVLCLLQLPVAVLVLIHPCCSRARHWWHR